VKSHINASYDCTMDDKALFPLYVCLDDGEVIRIEGFDRILYHLEAIDIENDEYMFWDATGHVLKILIQKRKVSGLEKIDNKVTLQQAFEGYAGQLAQRGATVDTSGTPEEIWAKVQKAKESLKGAPGFFSRLFRSKAK
jgi:hypothetical protein